MAVSFRLGETGRQKSTNQLFSQLGTDHARTQAKNAGIIILATLTRRENVVAECRADSPNLVGGDTGIHSAPAKQDAQFGFPGENGLPDGPGIVGVIYRIGTVGPHVQEGVSLPLQQFDHPAFQGETGVIRSDDDTHGHRIPSHRMKL